MDQWMVFAQDRWYIVLAAVIVLFLVIKVVKTVVKWIIVIAVLAGLLFYGANYMGQLKEMSGKLVGDWQTNLKAEALKALAGKDAAYKENPDGSFVVTKGEVQLTGKSGSNEVKISYMGQSITLKMDDAVRALIEEVKKNG